MKKQTLFLLALVVFFSCQKIQVKDDANINEKINQVRQTTTFLETQNGYDVYQDASGQKILLPSIQKKGSGQAFPIALNCDQNLAITYSGGHAYYSCGGSGSTCTWIVYNGEYIIAVCRGNIF